MSDTFTEEPGDAEEAEAPEQEAPEQEAGGGKPAGYDQVDFDNASRDEIKQRFNRIYGEMKRQGNMIKQFADDNRRLHDRVLNQEVVQQHDGFMERAETIQKDMQDAMDEGDAIKTAALVRELTQIELQAAGAQLPQQQQEPQPQQQPQPQYNPDTDAAGSDVLPPEDSDAIAAWAAERPQARPGHAHRGWVAFQLNDLYTNPDYAQMSVAQKLKEVDKRYQAYAGGNQRARQPDVIGEDGEQRRPRNRSKTPALSQDEKNVAVRMFPDMKYNDALVAYAKGK